MKTVARREATGLRKWTPAEVAVAWGVSNDKIISFINAGELRAVNAATPGRNRRPRYLIDLDDLAAFERSRETRPAPEKPVAKAKAQRQAGDRY